MTITYNKKIFKQLLLLFSLLTSFIGKAQDFIWASSTNYEAGYGYNDIRSIVTDSQGNIYSTGYFGGTVDFDPSANNFNLTASPTSIGFTNGFILKLDKDKNFLWVKQIKSNWADGGRSIILDKNENVIITGLATGLQIDLNPDEVGQYKINNPTGNPGSYIIKLDSDGNFVFGNYYAEAYAEESTLDNNNNIITTGVVGRTSVDFDAGTGVYNLNNNSEDIFILKNNSNGGFIWAKNIGGSRYDYPNGIVCDNFNNIIITGIFETNISFLNKTYTSNGNCGFICKIQPDGQNLWFRQLGDSGGSGGDKSIKIDRANNIYFGTSFSSMYRPFIPNFDNINLTFTSDSIDSILFKLNQEGNYIWHNFIYGSEWQHLGSLAFDKNENLYVTANVAGETFINNSCNKVFPNENTQISKESLLLKFDNSGNFINFKNIINLARSLQIDFENNILIGGPFLSQVDFDPSPKSTYFLHSFYSDGYILKLSECNSNVPKGEEIQRFCDSNIYKIEDLKPCSESVDWYDSLNSNTPLSKQTPIIDGQTYFAAYNDSCPLTDRLSVSVQFIPLPKPPVPSNLVFCKSENTKLSDIKIIGENVKWYNSLTDGNLLNNGLIIQDGITYYASQTVNGCESNRVIVKVVVNNNVPPTTTTLQTFCIQQNATISNIAITGQNIKWYNTLANGTLLSNTTPLQNGTIYYASQTINGCESDRIPVVINIQNTNAPTGNTTQTFCSSQNPTLDTIRVSGSAIKWYNSAGVLLSNSTPLQDGAIYYASQTVNACESTTKLAVTVFLINTLPANNYAELFCDDLNDRSEKVNLSDYNSKLISNTSGYTFSYYSTFSNAENQLATNQITTISNYKLVLGDNKIYVRINSNTPCYAIAELKLTLLSKPKITIPDVVPICENNTIMIDAGSGFETYLWSNGATTQSIIVANPGNFSVTVTDDYDSFYCSSTKNFIVKKSNIATITSIDTQDWTDNQNTISVFVTGAGDFEYSIDGIHFQDSNQFSNIINGQYNVSVRDKNGCGTVTDEVYLLMYPKFFTPNGDGYNDTWKIKFSDFEAGLTIKIFDRFGKFITELFESSSWDGMLNGHELTATDYWFLITRVNGKEYRGHFSLKR
ncbi:T9SS type B sorting domain-containing protein [Flavobacterium sp. GB2R13]|uniref:T9SS type B sorting domain-containing protein n=1 Tax=Flavobacterium algoris TaxID=3398733 RepID=UPI003A888A3E